MNNIINHKNAHNIHLNYCRDKRFNYPIIKKYLIIKRNIKPKYKKSYRML